MGNSSTVIASPTSTNSPSDSLTGVASTTATGSSSIPTFRTIPDQSDSSSKVTVPDAGGWKTSTAQFTQVTVINGSTSTLVFTTTIEVQQTPYSRTISPGAVAGVAIGSLLFLLLLIGTGLWWWRRRRNHVRFLYGISNLDFGTFLSTFIPAYKCTEKARQIATPWPGRLGSSRAMAPEHVIATRNCTETPSLMSSQSAPYRVPRI